MAPAVVVYTISRVAAVLQGEVLLIQNSICNNTSTILCITAPQLV